MISPEFPKNEIFRQKAVEKYQLLDTFPEESYDNITSLMAHVCNVPISLVTLLDKERNFLKSHYGIPFSESPREISFCGHAINAKEDITIIEDARIDERFFDNPLVREHNAIFYAGVPLVDPNGYKLGTLCVYDTQPRQLTQAQKNALLGMSKQVINLFEERYKNMKLQKLQEKLEERNQNLEKFASVVSHDLKSPLAQITTLTQLLEEDIKGDLNEETLQYLDYIRASSDSLRGYIDGILNFYKADKLHKNKRELINTKAYFEEVLSVFKGDVNVTINCELQPEHIKVNKAALTQILINLISNAIKYCDKPNPMVTITLQEKQNQYKIAVKDNGPGIPSDKQDKLFELFSTFHTEDRYGNQGTGIGLATVKKVVNSLGGVINVNSTLGNGTLFLIKMDNK